MTLTVTYPSSDFASLAKENLAKRAQLIVRADRGYQRYLIRKSIGIWPKKPGTNPEWAKGSGWSFALCMNFCPTMMVIHFAYMSAGYEMSFSVAEGLVEIQYFRQPRS